LATLSPQEGFEIPCFDRRQFEAFGSILREMKNCGNAIFVRTTSEIADNSHSEIPNPHNKISGQRRSHCGF
jgi:hypothetical protein